MSVLPKDGDVGSESARQNHQESPKRGPPPLTLQTAEPAGSVRQHVRDLNDSAGRILVAPWMMTSPTDKIPHYEPSFTPRRIVPMSVTERTSAAPKRRYVRHLDDSPGDILVAPFFMASPSDEIPYYHASFARHPITLQPSSRSRRYVRYLDDSAGPIVVGSWTMTSPKSEIPHYAASFYKRTPKPRGARHRARQYVRYLDDSTGRILVALWSMSSPNDEIPYFDASFAPPNRRQLKGSWYVRNLNDCAGQILVSTWVMTSPSDTIPFYEPSFCQPAVKLRCRKPAQAFWSRGKRRQG